MRCRFGVLVLTLFGCNAADQSRATALAVGTATLHDGAPTPASFSSKDSANALARTDALLKQHCAHCHDASHRINLTTAPPMSDVGAWSALREAVGSGAMPPPRPAAPFPLDPAVRHELVLGLSKIVSAAPSTRAKLKAGEGILRLSAKSWLEAATRVGAPYVTGEQVEGIARRHLGGIGGNRGGDDEDYRGALIPQTLGRNGFAAGLGQMNKNFVSYEVCSKVVDGELARPADQRPTLGNVDLAGPRLTDDRTGDLACSLTRHVFQEECTVRDREEGIRMFRTFESVTGASRTATVALCTTYLSGPRLAFLTPAPAGATR